MSVVYQSDKTFHKFKAYIWTYKNVLIFDDKLIINKAVGALLRI